MNKRRFVLLAGVLILGLCQTASAQFMGNGQLPTMPQLPNNAGIQGSNLTPDQFRNIMMLRALQSRGMGRGQVRTGVPQFIPFGSGNINSNGINNGSFAGSNQTQDTSQSGSTRKSSSQKRAEARAAREEEKKAKAEAAKEKRAQSAQASADPEPKSKSGAKSKSKSTSAKSTAAKSKAKSKSAGKSTSSKSSKSKSDDSSDPADE